MPASTPTLTEEPTELGFYKYSGDGQTMIFLLLPTDEGRGRQWKVVFDNGTFESCQWGYIEQALSVWTLDKI